jgi:hypothetical protein
MRSSRVRSFSSQTLWPERCLKNAAECRGSPARDGADRPRHRRFAPRLRFHPREEGPPPPRVGQAVSPAGSGGSPAGPSRDRQRGACRSSSKHRPSETDARAARQARRLRVRRRGRGPARSAKTRRLLTDFVIVGRSLSDATLPGKPRAAQDRKVLSYGQARGNAEIGSATTDGHVSTIDRIPPGAM